MKQLTFPQIMDCTLIYPDGKMERIRFGQYEAIMITKENGWDVDRTRPAIVPSTFVTHVTKTDGIKVVFDEPWYKQVNPDL
jgi:hypothetical protein